MPAGWDGAGAPGGPHQGQSPARGAPDPAPRIEDLDVKAGTLRLMRTRVVVDGRVVESDGKTNNAQRIVVLDPLTLALLRAHVEMLSRERAEFGSGYGDSGLLFCWEDGRPVHPDTITSRFSKIVESAGLPKINLHDVRHSYASAGRDAKIDWKALSERIGHSDVAFRMRQYVQTDVGSAPPGRNRPSRADPRRRSVRCRVPRSARQRAW